jgi:hypothetical protein
MSRRFGQPHIVRHELMDRIPKASCRREMNGIKASQQKWFQVSGILKQLIIQA